VHTPASAAADVVRAYRTAVEQRRTVVLNLPLDVQAASAPDVPLPAVPRLGPVRPAAVAEFAGLLAAAERPVFVAGRGARSAGRELRALGTASGALLATSAVAHGLFADDPWSLGISGGFASPLAAELIRDADLVVGWGCALNMWTTRHGTLIGPGARVVQVDLDADAIGAHRPVDLGVLGDVAATASDLLGVVAPRTGYRTDAVRAAIAARVRWRDVRTTTSPARGHRPAHALDRAGRRAAARADRRRRLRQLHGLPECLPVGAGRGRVLLHAGVPVDRAGVGDGGRRGARAARPGGRRRARRRRGADGGRRAGDRGAAGIPMVVVVYDDRGYGAEVHHFPDADHATVTFPEIDLSAVGRGYGFEAVTVRAPADLEGVADWVTGPRRAPLLVHAPIASDGGSWWLSEAFRGH
jgi:thiamine pyrophosphate-dependent acetolactate synthase large subunit-like protein